MDTGFAYVGKRMPFTPERVLAALKKKERKQL